jgi:hypothetical protein
VIGGTPDKPSRGVLLRLVSAPPGTSDVEIAAAIESARTEPDLWEEEHARTPTSAAKAPREPPRVAITLELDGPTHDVPAPKARWPWMLLVPLGGAVFVYLLTR